MIKPIVPLQIAHRIIQKENDITVESYNAPYTVYKQANKDLEKGKNFDDHA